MATRLDRILEVTPDTDAVFQIDCSAWQIIGDGDTVASGEITWEPALTAPTTVDTPTASSPPDQFLNVHITGFADATTYLMQAKITSTGGAVEDYYIKFICSEPTGF